MIMSLAVRRVRSFQCPRLLSSAVDRGLDPETSRAVLQMLAGPEANRMLEQYAAYPGAAFAVIKVGGEVVRDELSVLATSCTLLHRVGLKPIVIHGGGPQLNAELARDGVEPSYVRGHRVTDEVTLRIAERVFTDLNAEVARALEAMGTPAAAFSHGVFRAEVADPELGFVGEITGLDDASVLESLEMGRVPVLTSLGTSANGQVLNINADVAAREMALAVQPMRVVFTSAKGGWMDEETGRLSDVVDLTRKYDELAARDYTGRQGTLLKLNEIKLLLDQLPGGSSVTISSAAQIARNLFSTESGNGTLFVRGEPVIAYDSVGQLDLVKLASLLDAGTPSSSTVEDFRRLQLNTCRVYATPSLSSCAIVTEGEPPVLERFAVADVARGTGAAESLWERLREDFPALQWHGDTGHDLARWADGSYSDASGDEVFWCGNHPATTAASTSAAAGLDARTSNWENVETRV